MNCASCGQTNPAGSRFCSGCGASLALRCAACGTELPAGARFCNGCGAAVAQRSGAADVVSRKIVTIVFADLIGSVSLHERLDAESARRLMDRYHRAMAAAVDVHGGRVVQLLGDGVLAAFGVPRVAEDDAIRAVRAAVGMQRAFRELAREQSAAMAGVGLRVAVNTGEIVVSDDENSVMGDPTNVAARLQQEARDGDVIVGEGTQRLVGELVTLAPLGTFALRGRAEAVAAYRVVSLERPASRQATAFVGREEELRRLTAVYDAALATPAARLAVLLGSPGLGKSRLVAEFTRRAGERATVLAARCDAAGGATFAPLAEALRALLRIDEGAGGDVLRAAIDAVVSGDDAERTRIATGIGALLAGTPAPPEETFFVVRRLLAALAAVRPVVLVIDDLQWAEPLLLDLVEHLVQWSSGVPLLVLVAARPELRDARSSLATPGALVSDVVTLGGLDAGAATRLAANVIGGSELPAALAGRVLATSEGNPLFVSELVRMLVQDGTLQRDGDRWITTVEIAKLDMPPTIQVLLAARIERLRPEERSVLERAAVVGRQFSRAAVAHLLRDAGDLDARLEALRRSELIEPDTGWFLGEPALRFHHVLIRDAAYRRVLKETRAELHARISDWIVARVGDAIEHDETIGWHLEQAHQHLRELGPLDDAGRSLGERAARHLGAAGRRALARDDLPLAASLLGRAIDRLDAGDPARADLALDWCEALLAAGDVGPAAAAIDELARFCGDSERLRAWHTCFAGQLAALTDPQALRTTADAVANAAEQLVALEDAAGEAKAHFVHAMALVRLGKIGACEAALDRALAAARRARDRRRANAVLAGAPVAALWGPSPVTRASGRCLDVVRVLRITQGAPAVEAVALRCQGVLEALRGRTDAARRMVASSRRLVEELGITQRLLESDVFAGHVELIEGDAEAAERWLRTAYAGLRDLGLGIDAAQAGALLGRALLAQGRAAEAEALSHESEALAGDDLKAAITWRGVRAEALARRGEHAAAIEFARAAVEIAAATDDLLDHADARQALSVALHAAGRGAEADAEEMRAIELWEAKGATLLVERARDRGGRVAVEAPAALTPAPSHRRRVLPNAATEHARRLDAAVAARDADAVARLSAPELEVVHHPTGASYRHAMEIERFRAVFQDARALSFHHEPWATLGDSLALCRAMSASGGALLGDFDAGAFEIDSFVLIEADASAQSTHVEVFASDHLADAIARLYERYAELLPEGSERERAATTARAVRVVFALDASPSHGGFVARDYAFIDHRILGFPPYQGDRGVEQLRASDRALRALAEDIAVRVEEIFALQADALLVRSTASGTHREGGGRFERPMLQIRTFDGAGCMNRTEWFDVDDVAAALARFDALTSSRSPSRRVRPNASSACGERIRAAAHARDRDAIAALIADDFQLLHHPTGGAVDREAGLTRWRMLFQAEELQLSWEPLATLGDSLELGRDVTSFAGLVQDDLSFGASRSSYVNLGEVNDRGQVVRIEVFADNRLAAAVARLYARHAVLLPDGAARMRAAATARSVAALLGPPDLAAYRTAFAADIASTDRRTLGWGSMQGREALVRGFRSLFETTDGLAIRVDDVLGLESDAVLMRWTVSGIDRVGGGAFERHFLLLWVFGADGLVTRSEQFDADRTAEALARFDELAAPRTPARRVRQNAATANNARLVAAVAARDGDALARVFADGAETLHHATGVLYDRDVAVARLQALLAARDLAFDDEPLATLGDSLELGRGRISYSALVEGDIDVGAVERDEIVLVEADEDGRRRRSEIFSDDQLAAAVARLYERYAELLGAGPERERAAATARAVAAVLLVGPTRPLDGVLASDVEFLDHRMLGFPPGRGADAIARGSRSLFDSADDTTVRVHDILDLRPDAFLLRSTTSGTDRASGGRFDRDCLQLRSFDAAGRLARVEFFEADRDAEALARFDQLVATPPAASFGNAASRAVREFERRWQAGDWDGVLAMHGSDFVMDDRRAIARMQVTGGEFLENLRLLFATRVSRFESALIATRGERLSLSSVLFHGEVGDGAPIEIPHLAIVEVTTDGSYLALVLFDPGDLDAAYVELDRRYAAASAHYEVLSRDPVEDRRATVTQAFSEAFARRDWDALAALLAPDLVVDDHRLLGWETLHGPAAYVRALQSIVELAPDTQLRIDHVSIAAPRFLYVTTWVGTRDGGAFEAPSVIVSELDADGRIRRFDQYDIDRLEEIHARFATSDAPAVPDQLRIPPNAVTRAMERWNAAAVARDWDAVEGHFAPEFRFEDRRRGLRDSGDRTKMFASIRVAVSAGAVAVQETFATAGDRLALQRICFEVETLQVAEVDAAGRLVACISFDPDDRRAASLELFERFARSQGERWPIPEALAVRRAFCEHDLAGLRALLPDDLVFHDHRRTGAGRLEGRDAYIEWLAALFERSRDALIEPLYYLTVEAHGYLAVAHNFGTLEDGGAFETVFIQLVCGGRGELYELFEIDQLDAARARFEALRPDPLHIPPNAATQTSERLQRVLGARDWSGLRALCAPAMRYDDRRRRALLSGDRELFIASNREVLANDPRLAATVLATAGDRLALHHLRWSGTTADVGAHESESISLLEIDANDRIVAIVAFDPDDRRAASVEMLDRYFRGEGARFTPAGTIEFVRAGNAHDLAAMRAALPDDYFFHDHRRTGVGRIDNADDYVASCAALWELSRDWATDTLYHVAVAEHGSLNVGRMFGTLADGGAFESLFVRLSWYENGAVRGTELFELEELDRARELFEARRPHLLTIPPNAASRAGERLRECALTADWDTLRELCAPIIFEDRRPLFRIRGDCEMFLANTQAIDRSIWQRSTRTLLATAGDRLALHHNQWRGDEAAAAFEIDTLEITEVDAEGRIVAAILFDPGDRRAAGIELIERSTESERDASRRAAWRERMRALIDHDLERLRAAVPSDWVYHDHRRVGAGRLDKESYLAWLAALFAESPDALIERLYDIADEPHAVLSVGHTFGTRVDGGAFESVFVQVLGQRGVELFELDDLQRARARFEALRPDPLRIPPNAATRVMDRLRDAREAGDWDAMGALCSPSMLFDDRRRGTLLRGDREMFLASSRVVASYDAQISATLLATAGDRLALRRLHFGGSAGGGPVEAEALSLVEVDADGRIAAIVSFDPEDRRAASAELTERFARGGEAPPFVASSPHVMRALIERDVEPLRAALPDDFVVDDHRRAGMGRVEGAAAFIESFDALYELSPDLVVEGLYTVMSGERALLDMAHMFGTLAASGGEFESVYLRLFSFERDRIVGLELFEPDDLDAARARFEALHSDRRIAPNAASRLSARGAKALAADDWQTALRALAAPAFRFEDRRRRALLDGDIELWLRNLEVIRAWPGRRSSGELLATFGDRVVLERISFTGGTDGGDYEGEFLRIVAADANGLLEAVIHFDVDDRDVAVAEARRRA